jgi:hypothetical protein
MQLAEEGMRKAASELAKISTVAAQAEATGSVIQKARTEALEAIRQAVSDGGAVQAGDRLDLGKLKDKVRVIGNELSELQVRCDQAPGLSEADVDEVARLQRRLDDMGPQMAR